MKFMLHSPIYPTNECVWPTKILIDPDFAIRVPNCNLFTLTNGIRVVLMTGPQDRSSFIKVLVNGGAIHQNPKQRGIPHMMEHMLFQGTEEFADNEQLVNFLRDFNIDYNGATSDDQQYYYAIADNDDDSLEAAFRYLSQTVLHPVFPEDVFLKERDVVMAERKAGESEPDKVEYEVFINHFADEKDPLAGGLVIGTQEDIAGFELEHVKDFYHNYFHPQNMVLVVSGGREPEIYLGLIRKFFETDGRGKKWDKNPTLGAKVRKRELETISVQDFQHVHVVSGLYFAEDEEISYLSPEYVGMNLLADILSFRVFNDVRDKKGLAYSTGASFDDIGPGYFFSTDGDFPPEKYVTGRKEIEKYITDIVRHPVNEQEFTQAIRVAKSTRWARDNRSIANSIGSKMFFRGQPVSPEGYNRFYDQVTLDGLNQLALRMLQSREVETIVAGPV